MKNRLWSLPLLFIFVLIGVLRLSGTTALSFAAPTADTFIYLPIISKPPSADLTISSLEVSQSIQTTGNTVDLVANRSTVVRVFAQTIQGDEPTGVTVSLSAARGGTALGTVTVGPQTVPAAPIRSDYNSTFNVILPNAWLSGSVVLDVQVDSADVVAESDESNNTTSMTLNFNQTPSLTVKIVPINYTHQGATNPGYYPGDAVDHISDWIMRAYPVSAVTISYRNPYAFTGNLDNGSEWSRLLNEITSLKSSDGASASQIYYAFVPIQNGSQQWFYSGIAGIGWVGYKRVSVGLDLGAGDSTGTLAGHEIGHNLGRYHAPCGVSNPDPNYPYANASINDYGLDIVSPSVTLLSPGTYKDMMSYCGPAWVSDYTYNALYADLQSYSVVAAPAANSMFVRVQFDEAGTAVLQPIYTFESVPTTAATDGDYVVELLDGAGHVLAAQSVTVVQAEEPGVTARAIYAHIPVPQEPVAAVRLIQGETAVLQRQLTQSPTTLAQIITVRQKADFVTVSWGTPDTLALVRYTTDDGQTWTTLGMDVLGGRLTILKELLPQGNGRFQVIPADTGTASGLTAELVLR